jgi:hypothetical protein
LLQARSLRTQISALDAATANQARSLDNKLESLIEPKASSESGMTAPRGLERTNNDLQGLYEQVSSADAAPTRAQSSAAEQLLKDWAAMDVASTDIWKKDVPALNLALKKAGLKTLRDEAETNEGSTQVDED